jgi:hypothetical protein
MIRHSVKALLLIPALALAACGRSGDKPMDDALRSDLSLASQVQPYQPQQTISPTELGYANGATPYAPGYAPAPRPYNAAPAPVRTRTVYRSAPARSTSAGTYEPAPQRTRIEKHTGRDAAIGAAAGAILGGVTSRNKVKGAVIGAAAGGILGAVIGNNVDKKKVP